MGATKLLAPGGLLRGATSEKFIDRSHKTGRGRRSRNISAQNFGKRNVVSVNLLCVSSILVHNVSIEVDTRKETLTTGISEELGIRQLGRGCLSVSANRARGN
jgi:hypothetical protein